MADTMDRAEQEAPPTPTPITFRYFAGRPLTVGDEVRAKGAEVPEAQDWPYVESWIATGHLIPVPVDAGTQALLERIEQQDTVIASLTKRLEMVEKAAHQHQPQQGQQKKGS